MTLVYSFCSLLLFGILKSSWVETYSDSENQTIKTPYRSQTNHGEKSQNFLSEELISRVVRIISRNEAETSGNNGADFSSFAKTDFQISSPFPSIVLEEFHDTLSSESPGTKQEKSLQGSHNGNDIKPIRHSSILFDTPSPSKRISQFVISQDSYGYGTLLSKNGPKLQPLRGHRRND